ncbi:MAG: transposase [Gammaproteobacteria bacterium]|nr:transposase [Gammaproteobacteria bacterium]
MPRQPRTVFAGVPHHVTQRGNRRGQVFFTDADRRVYLSWLRQYAAAAAVEVVAYCLMTNHVHLVVVPAVTHGLYQFLKPLNMRFAQRINRLREWKGHVWQGRFHSSALDETGLLMAVRYVERNPVRAGLVSRAEEYFWSSAGAHCGFGRDPVLTSASRWHEALECVGDWSQWLAISDDSHSQEDLRRCTEQNLPCGSPVFIETLERDSGRPLRSRGPGRARKGDASLFREPGRDAD